MGKQVLVVDDEATARQVLEAMLGSSGYEVRTASGAEEALDILAREDINVIFLDLKLFGVSGIELCRKIRKLKPLAIVQGVTGLEALY